MQNNLSSDELQNQLNLQSNMIGDGGLDNLNTEGFMNYTMGDILNGNNIVPQNQPNPNIQNNMSQNGNYNGLALQLIQIIITQQHFQNIIAQRCYQIIIALRNLILSLTVTNNIYNPSSFYELLEAVNRQIVNIKNQFNSFPTLNNFFFNVEQEENGGLSIDNNVMQSGMNGDMNEGIARDETLDDSNDMPARGMVVSNSTSQDHDEGTEGNENRNSCTIVNFINDFNTNNHVNEENNNPLIIYRGLSSNNGNASFLFIFSLIQNISLIIARVYRKPNNELVRQINYEVRNNIAFIELPTNTQTDKYFQLLSLISENGTVYDVKFELRHEKILQRNFVNNPNLFICNQTRYTVWFDKKRGNSKNIINLM